MILTKSDTEIILRDLTLLEMLVHCDSKQMGYDIISKHHQYRRPNIYYIAGEYFFYHPIFENKIKEDSGIIKICEFVFTEYYYLLGYEKSERHLKYTNKIINKEILTEGIYKFNDKPDKYIESIKHFTTFFKQKL